MSVTVAHLSDLHITPIRFRHIPWRLNKRPLAWLKWSLQRSKVHRPEVLEAVLTDLEAQQPDHIVVTGDLTNIGLEDELRSAVPWLQRLGNPDRVSLVPGNHDTYTSASQAALWSHWQAYLRPDTLSTFDLMNDDPNAPFPTVRIRGQLAFIGVCSGRPTNIFHATGFLGPGQLSRLEAVLQSLRDTPLCRIVLMHHPPTQAGLSKRRCLRDAEAVQHVLASAGAELVLHGHTHKTTLTSIPRQAGLPAIPVVGVRSASAASHRPHRTAQYHLYRIESDQGLADRASNRSPGFRMTLTIRGYDIDSGRLTQVCQSTLAPLEKNSLSADVFSVISA